MLAPSPATATQAALKGGVRSARSSSQAIEDNQLYTKILLFMNILIIENLKIWFRVCSVLQNLVSTSNNIKYAMQRIYVKLLTDLKLVS